MTSLLRRSLLAGAAVLLTATAACSSGGSSSAGAPGEIDRSATLRIGFAASTPGLDPAQQTAAAAMGSTFLLYDRLTRMSNDLQVEPMLATKWTFAPDGSSLDLDLRQGVTFHDGTPLDAAAVKGSLDRAITLPGSTVANQLASVAGVEVVDADTVRLRLKPGRGAELPAVLATNVGEIISPKAIADGRDLGTAPGDAGSGPYTVTEFRPNEKIVYERAAGTYWDADAGFPQRIELTYFADGTARVNGLRAGQLDLVHLTGADVATAVRLGDTGAFKVHVVNTLVNFEFFLRSDLPTFADARLRQAISYAIDRAAIGQALDGNCDPTLQIYPQGNWAHADGLDPAAAFNPDRARALLAEIGGPPPRLSVAVPAASSMPKIAQVVQSQLAAVGIQLDLVSMPLRDAISAYQEGRQPALIHALSPTPDPSQLVAQTYLGPYRAAGAMTPQVQELAATAANPLQTQEQRGAVFGQIWKLTQDQATMLNLCAAKQAWGYQPKVTGVDDMPWTWAGVFDARGVAVTSAAK